MNIFVLDVNPKKAAAYHCDRHVVKMILETAQMLCTAHWLTGNKKGIPPYKSTHAKHPCNLWLMESIANYRWLVKLGLALLEEYCLRYPGKAHKTEPVMVWLVKNEPPLADKRRTTFAQAMPEIYRTKDAVTAYRNYYLGEKAKFCTWKNQTPDWWPKKK